MSDIDYDPSTGHPIFAAKPWVEVEAPEPPQHEPPAEDLSELMVETPTGEPRLIAGENVVDNIVHHAVITPDEQPDLCGGCAQEWPCPNAHRLMVTQLERYVDPEALRADSLSLAPFTR